jgi:hypothetical protein
MTDETASGESVEILTSKLQILPPESQIEISWSSTSNETHRVQGEIVDYHHNSAARRIETEDRTLLLVPDTSHEEITVSELTTAAMMNSLGTLQTVTGLQHAKETLEINSKGVKLPPYLLGYSGFLVVDTHGCSKELRILEPGLNQYDDRLSCVIQELINEDEPSVVKIRLRSGPHRQYEIIDNQIESNTDESKETVVEADYSSLEPLIHTVAALTEKIRDDKQLSKDVTKEALHKLQSLQTPLLKAYSVLCDSESDATSIPSAQQADVDTIDYPTILEQIQAELKQLTDTVCDEPNMDVRSQQIYSLIPAQRTIDDLFSLLTPPIPDVDDYDGGSYIPPREYTEGRGNGDGRWLEYQLSNALIRWGYHTDMRENVYCVEIDVVASRRKKQNDPTDWIVAECKDWESRPITPDVIFRLCMLAYTCRAMPLLCHTTHLTERAMEIARTWEVRVLKLEDLYRGSLPAPDALDIQYDIDTYRYPEALRESRSMLPIIFSNRPNNHFTYVPGYKPDGPLYRYKSVEEEDTAEND